jgi:predicted O-methyltransferase YrrM
MPSPLTDPAVNAVIDRLQTARNRPPDGGPRNSAQSKDPYAYAEFGFSIHPDQGDLIYLLCRGLRARLVVEFATSVGMSTLYFAAAMRDNGGGRVIGAELVAAKAAIARANLAAAGLDGYAEIREGDARETLRALPGPVDFLLIDGWPSEAPPSLALQMVTMLAPSVRQGGFVMNDNAEPDYLAFVRDPANGFLSVSLPLKGATELSVKVAS